MSPFGFPVLAARPVRSASPRQRISRHQVTLDRCLRAPSAASGTRQQPVTAPSVRPSAPRLVAIHHHHLRTSIPILRYQQQLPRVVLRLFTPSDIPHPLPHRPVKTKPPPQADTHRLLLLQPLLLPVVIIVLHLDLPPHRAELVTCPLQKQLHWPLTLCRQTLPARDPHAHTPPARLQHLLTLLRQLLSTVTLPHRCLPVHTPKIRRQLTQHRPNRAIQLCCVLLPHAPPHQQPLPLPAHHPLPYHLPFLEPPSHSARHQRVEPAHRLSVAVFTPQKRVELLQL